MSDLNWLPESLLPGNSWTQSYLEAQRRQYEGDLNDAVLAVIECRDEVVRLLSLKTVEGEVARDLIRQVDVRLRQCLEGLGASPIAAVGQTVDPRFHHVEAVVAEQGEPGRIVREIRAGYVFRDRVLRPSVVVSIQSESLADGYREHSGDAYT